MTTSTARGNRPSARAAVRGAWLLFAALLMSTGCQRTLFSQPPAAARGCDAALHGHWVSVDRDGKADGELEATLGTDCRLAVVEHRNDGPREWPSVAVASTRIGRRDLVWLDADSVNRAFDIDAGPVDREGAAYVFVYALDGERLDLLQPDHRRLAHGVVDGSIDGAAFIDGRDIAVRVDGDEATLTTLLRERRTFQRKDPLRFRRIAPDVEH
jgi:hypothetical protein